MDANAFFIEIQKNANAFFRCECALNMVNDVSNHCITVYSSDTASHVDSTRPEWHHIVRRSRLCADGGAVYTIRGGHPSHTLTYFFWGGGRGRSGSTEKDSNRRVGGKETLIQ